MYKRNTPDKTTLKVNTSYEGETIEKKIARILNNKEPVKDGAPIIYTARKDGVQPQYDVRTDRWEQAIEATNYITKSKLAERQKNLGEQAKENMAKENSPKDGGAEPIQPTQSN